MRVRAVRLSDCDLIIDFHSRLRSHSKELSLLGACPVLEGAHAERLATADFSRSVGFVAERSRAELVGIAHLVNVNKRARFGIVVRDDYQCVGVGTALFQHLLEAARHCDARVLTGSVLPENIPMLRLVQRFGATPIYEDPREIVMALSLERSRSYAGPFGSRSNTPRPVVTGTSELLVGQVVE